MIHFDGFSLLLMIVCSWAGYAIGCRRCRSHSKLANDAEAIAMARDLSGRVE